MLNTCRDVAFRVLRDWIVAGTIASKADAVANATAPKANATAPPKADAVANAAGVVNCTRLGREPRRPWRARPSRRRLRKVHATPGHPLCGLVGYSE